MKHTTENTFDFSAGKFDEPLTVYGDRYRDYFSISSLPCASGGNDVKIVLREEQAYALRDAIDKALKEKAEANEPNSSSVYVPGCWSKREPS